MRAWIIGAAAFVVLFFAALWVGAWAIDHYAKTWIVIPAMLSLLFGCIGFFVGFMFCIAGASKAKVKGP